MVEDAPRTVRIGIVDPRWASCIVVGKRFSVLGTGIQEEQPRVDASIIIVILVQRVWGLATFSDQPHSWIDTGGQDNDVRFPDRQCCP